MASTHVLTGVTDENLAQGRPAFCPAPAAASGRSGSDSVRRLIVEHEQKGKLRAEYGKQLIIALSERLTVEFGRGFSRSNLKNMRKFFLTYGERRRAIGQKPSGLSVAAWSFPELKRQVGSSLYERLALSRDKNRVRDLAAKGQVIARPEDMLKSPYVLEFLGLDERPAYSESDLEAAIIGNTMA